MIEKKNARYNLALTGSFYSLMLAYAISTTMIGPLMPSYIKQYQIHMAAGGLFTSFQGLGGVVSILAGSILLDRVRKIPVVTLSFLVYTLSLLSIALFGTYGMLIFLFFMIGGSTKLMDAAINSSLADIHQERRGVFVNLLHTFFGIGTLIGPLFSAWLIKKNDSPSHIFMLLGLFCCLIFVPYLILLKKSPTTQSKPVATKMANPLIFLKNKQVLFIGLTGFSYTALSASLSTWMPLYMQTDLKTDLLISSLPVTMFAIGLIVGRMVCSALAAWAKMVNLLMVSHFVCAGLWFIAFFVKMPFVFFLAAGVAGFCVSGVVPVAVSIVCGIYPTQTGSISSLIFLFVTMGYMVVPGLVGVVAQVTNLWLALMLLGLMPLLAAVSYYKIRSY